MIDSRLPPDQQSLLDTEMRPSETLLWAAQPSPERMARLARPQFLMGIPFTVFAIVWEAFALTAITGVLFSHGLKATSKGTFPFAFALIFPLFGALFVAAGIYQLLAPIRQRQALQIVYAIMPERILVLQSGRKTGTIDARVLPPEQIRNRSRTQQRDGSGDILFPGAGNMNPTHFMERYFYAASRQLTAPPVGFYGIADVRSVDDLIGRTFDGMPPPGTA